MNVGQGKRTISTICKNKQGNQGRDDKSGRPKNPFVKIQKDFYLKSRCVE